MSVLKLEVAMRTDRGKVRENNEDAIGGDISAGLVVLADGMGGANAGEVASQLAVEMMINELVVARGSATQALEEAEIQQVMQRVNLAILDLAKNVPEYNGMGTTLTMGHFHDNRLTYAHVGDSRLYRYREGSLMVMTRDHTLVQELVALGEFESVDDAMQAGVSPNILTRAFGSEEDFQADIADCEVRQDDLFLFCSDGLTTMLSDGEIAQVLAQPEDDLSKRVDQLIEKACSMGGVDNVSVILANVVAGNDSNKKGLR